MDDAEIRSSALAHQQHCQNMMQQGLAMIEHHGRVMKPAEFLSDDDKVAVQAKIDEYVAFAKSVVQGYVDDCAAKIELLK